jgi:hypothetical protein
VAGSRLTRQSLRLAAVDFVGNLKNLRAAEHGSYEMQLQLPVRPVMFPRLL